MKKLVIIGNPNTGKSTLFNSITHSDIKTGNWHGVTVEANGKVIQSGGESVEVVDLPGMYSMTSFSYEEQVSIDYIKNNSSAGYLLITDANSLRRNLYLAMQLKQMNIKYVLYINNYDIFTKNGNAIDAAALSDALGMTVMVGNASKQKYNTKMYTPQTRHTIRVLDDDESDRKHRYDLIEVIYRACVKCDESYIYGNSRLNKVLLNKWLFLPIFFCIIFLIMYTTFFLVGNRLSSGLIYIFDLLIAEPSMWLLHKTVNIDVIIGAIDSGVFSAVKSVLSFVFPVILLHVSIGLLEDSGYMSRLAFHLDDGMSAVGLSGKSVYTLMMGFGCNTSAIYTARGVADKNLRIKTSILTQYMSCSAKLPIYSVIAGAIFGAKSIWVIFGLYVLGVVIALLVSLVLEKTCLPSRRDRFLIEFPVMRAPNVAKVIRSVFVSLRHFFAKVFTVVICVSLVVWLLQNFNFALRYIPYGQENILPKIASFITPLLRPIGLGNEYMVIALLVGIMAKELILSSIAMSNAQSGLTLVSSLVLGSSAVSFSSASALSFLVFVLLYSPCVSSMAVLGKEIGSKCTLLTIVSQLAIAYTAAYMVYSLMTMSIMWWEWALILAICTMALYGVRCIFTRNKCNMCTLKCSNKSRCKKTHQND